MNTKLSERRMFTQKITESDVFLDMPLSSQALYFHLCMYADDDGYVKNPKRISRMIGSSDDDFKLLIAKAFVISFESGVIVIKHWRMHNLLRKDRYIPSEYTEEKSMLFIKDNGSYTLDKTKGKPLTTTLATKWQPNGNQMATQDSIGKDSIGKDNNKNYCVEFEELWKLYPRKKEKKSGYKCYCNRLKNGNTHDDLLKAVKNYAAECNKNKTEEKFIKHMSTFFSANEPFKDYIEMENDNGTNKRDSSENYEYSEDVKKLYGL